MYLIPDQTGAREELNKQYIFVGGGTIIAMFFIVIVLQLYTCKRSRSAKIKKLNKKCEETDVSEELVDDEQHRNENESTIPTERNKTDENETVESEYCDVDELESRHNSSLLSDVSTEYERPQILPNSILSYSPLTPRSSFHFQRLNYHSVAPTNGQCEENNSNLYLQPISDIEILSQIEINTPDSIDEIN